MYEIAFLLASQIPPDAVPAAVWPYYVAIGALSSAVVAMFGVILKQNSAHHDQIRSMYSDAAKALEEQARRSGEEFKGDKQTIVDLATRLAGLVEKVTASMDVNTAALKEREHHG